jgi:hypothetical protein
LRGCASRFRLRHRGRAGCGRSYIDTVDRDVHDRHGWRLLGRHAGWAHFVAERRAWHDRCDRSRADIDGRGGYDRFAADGTGGLRSLRALRAA